MNVHGRWTFIYMNFFECKWTLTTVLMNVLFCWIFKYVHELFCRWKYWNISERTINEILITNSPIIRKRPKTFETSMNVQRVSCENRGWYVKIWLILKNKAFFYNCTSERLNLKDRRLAATFFSTNLMVLLRTNKLEFSKKILKIIFLN